MRAATLLIALALAGCAGDGQDPGAIAQNMCLLGCHANSCGTGTVTAFGSGTGAAAENTPNTFSPGSVNPFDAINPLGPIMPYAPVAPPATGAKVR